MKLLAKTFDRFPQRLLCALIGTTRSIDMAVHPLHRLRSHKRQSAREHLVEGDAERWIDNFPVGEHDTPDRLLIPEKLYGRARNVVSYLFREHQAIMSEVKELICIAGWPWPLGLDRLDGDERVELLNQVFEVQNHGTAKQGQRRFEPICERWRD
jgi:hypothetical protein